MPLLGGDVPDYNIAKNAWMEVEAAKMRPVEKQALKELIVRVGHGGRGRHDYGRWDQRRGHGVTARFAMFVGAKQPGHIQVDSLPLRRK